MTSEKSKKEIIEIKGMHCRSCEILIEEELKKIRGVHKVNVSEKKGTAEIFSDRVVDSREYGEAVKKAGYSLGRSRLNLISKNKSDYLDLLKGAIILAILFFLAKKLGVFELTFTNSGDYTSVPVVFLVGLTAGLSTCMALVGGLVLAVSGKYAEQNPGLSSAQKFRPHIIFNVGRVVLFTVFGAILGLLGSFFQFSLSSIGVLTVFVGITMLLLGLQTLNIFHFLDKIKLTLPKSIYRLLGIQNYNKSAYSDRGAFIMGGLTFFLPCGFTQTMQLFAMTSGDPFIGAITMSVFALGTAPGLLGVGGLTSVIKEHSSKLLFKVVGLLVILLSIYNISNGLNLAGINILRDNVQASNNLAIENCDLDEESSKAYEEKYGTKIVCNKTAGEPVQVIKSTYTVNDDMQPSSFTVKVNQPVRLEVEAKEDGAGCMGSLALPGLVKKYEVFRKNKTTVMEFTPTKTGTYQVTCAMGVPRGTLTVI